MRLEQKIKDAAIQLGYESCGIIQVDYFNDFVDGVEKHKSNFPHAAQLYDSIKYMANPKENIPWGNSIIVYLEEYDKYHIPIKLDDFIQRFDLLDDRLNYPKEFENKYVFQDYLKQIGLRAEEIIKACPTGALSAPMQMDVTRCNAYLTYKSISASGNKMNYSQCICDICQSVCPVNKKNETTSFKESLLLEKLMNLESIFSMDETIFFQLLQSTMVIWKKTALGYGSVI